MEGLDGKAVGAERFDALDAGLGGGNRGHDGNFVLESAGADLNFLRAGDGSGWGIDHQDNFPIFD